MLITRETDYGMRIIRALIKMEKMTVTEICKQEQIPASFTYKILKKLDKSGLVTVIRGAKGGYQLSKNPAEITMLDILMAIDGDVLINKCQAKGYQCEYVECTKDNCRYYQELVRVQKIVEEELSRFSIKEILGINENM
jgi:Rrf2 family protein